MEQQSKGRFTRRDQQPQDHKFIVDRVHQFNDGSITFNMTIDGFITVYGCRIYDGQDCKPFVTFPSRKDKDGKYWNHVYCKLTEAQVEDIARQVEEKLA